MEFLKIYKDVFSPEECRMLIEDFGNSQHSNNNTIRNVSTMQFIAMKLNRIIPLGLFNRKLQGMKSTYDFHLMKKGDVRKMLPANSSEDSFVSLIVFLGGDIKEDVFRVRINAKDTHNMIPRLGTVLAITSSTEFEIIGFDHGYFTYLQFSINYA